MTLKDLENTKWVGTKELWLDKLGNDAKTSPCSITVGASAIDYRWSHDGKDHVGKLALGPEGAVDFTDTFHASNAMTLQGVAGTWALVDAQGTWSPGEGPPWGWRITVSHKPPTDELILQMTIIKPWGEQGRAVRMICKRA